MSRKKHPPQWADATSYMITFYFLIVFNIVPILNAGTLRAGTLTCLPVRGSGHIRAARITTILSMAES